MNLPMIGGPGPAQPQSAPPAGNGNGAADGGDFARLLDGGAPAAEAADTKPSTGTASRRDAGDQRGTAAAGRDGQRQRAADARPEPAPGEEAVATTGTSADATADTPARDAGLESGGWPPPGLASLLDPAALAAPTAAPPPAAGPDDTRMLPRGGLPAIAGPGIAPSANAPVAAPSAQAPAEPQPGDTVAPLLQAANATVNDAAGGTEPAPPAGLPFALPAAAPAAATGATAPAPPLSAAQAPVPQLHGEGFADDIGTHVQWLAGQKIGHAHIRISPQELGPVEIRLQLDGDRISAEFSSAQAEVRQALENGLPRLREMLGQHGFQLAHAGVGQQSRQDGGERQGPSPNGLGGESDGDEPATATPLRRIARGLLDAYA